MPTAPAADERARLALLRRVSRSFYLSVRLLPGALRQPVAAGYLLARASDTIADAPGWPASQRLAMLDAFLQALRSGSVPAPIDGSALPDSGERDLIAALPQVIAWANALSVADREDVLAVLGHITHGQRLDIERFADASPERPRSLPDAKALDEYTYLVAGCVGEFWTRLGLRHVPGFASLPAPEMLGLARRYGQALQLVNVLRDSRADRALGRRYLPEGESAHDWLARANEGLRCGLRYSLALSSARMRVASALPALIGVRTVALLRRSPGEPVKVPRAEVRGLLVRLALSFGSRARIEREFRRWDNAPR